MVVALDELDLDAVTMADQPRRPFGLGAGMQAASDCPQSAESVDWAQTTEAVTIFVRLGAAVRAKDLRVELKRTWLRVCLRGQEGPPLLSGALGGACAVDECDWQVLSGELVLSLAKAQRREWAVPVDAGTPWTSTALAPAAPLAAAPPARTDIAPRPLPTPAAGGPIEAASGARIGDRYEAWDRFDETGALLALENEGKLDEPNWAVRVGGGAAGIQCADYKKDREEVELDEELATKRLELQELLNRRLTEAATLKQRGNERLRDGQPQAALEAYLEGCEALEMLGESTAGPLLSARLSESATSLRRDLLNNAAQAALNAGAWEAAIESATAVLKLEPTNAKALYRRASGYMHSARAEEARADLLTLLSAQPTHRAAHELLRAVGPSSDVLV